VTELTLHLERRLPAPRSRVFEACTQPEPLAKWWGPKDFTSPSLELDLRVGGSYRIAMQPPDGDLFHLTGEYLEIDPPYRLAYTFRWEDPDPDDQETVVTISLWDVRESTELVLDQGPFATQARYDLHHAGWRDGLERLADALS
jgi:uncharacterized protein YndB with AHSA1/START domain